MMNRETAAKILKFAAAYESFIVRLEEIAADNEIRQAATGHQERAQAALLAVIEMLHINGDQEYAEHFWPLIYGLQTVQTGIEAELFKPVSKTRGLDFPKRMLFSQASAVVDWLHDHRGMKVKEACEIVAESLTVAGYDFKTRAHAGDKSARPADQVFDWRKNINGGRRDDPNDDERDNYNRLLELMAPIDLPDNGRKKLKEQLAAMFKVSLDRFGR
jgi:hypothetical protein